MRMIIENFGFGQRDSILGQPVCCLSVSAQGTRPLCVELTRPFLPADRVHDMIKPVPRSTPPDPLIHPFRDSAGVGGRFWVGAGFPLCSVSFSWFPFAGSPGRWFFRPLNFSFCLCQVVSEPVQIIFKMLSHSQASWVCFSIAKVRKPICKLFKKADNVAGPTMETRYRR